MLQLESCQFESAAQLRNSLSVYHTETFSARPFIPKIPRWELLRWPAGEGCDCTGQLPAVNMSDCMRVKQSERAQLNTSPEVLPK